MEIGEGLGGLTGSGFLNEKAWAAGGHQWVRYK